MANLVEGVPGDAGVPVMRLGWGHHHGRKAVRCLDVRQHAVGALSRCQALPRICGGLHLYRRSHDGCRLLQQNISMQEVACPNHQALPAYVVPFNFGRAQTCKWT